MSRRQRDDVHELLRRAAVDGDAVRRLRALLSASTWGHLPLSRMRDHEVVRYAADLVRRGEWTLSPVEHKAITAVTLPASNGPMHEPAAATAPTPRARTPRRRSREAAPKSARAWIEFLLVDDETGDPLADIPVRITLTDGSTTERQTGDDGLIRIDDLSAGVCRIDEIRDDAGLEVVTVLSIKDDVLIPGSLR